jgi:uncharacterized delta-60 repeat protein
MNIHRPLWAITCVLFSTLLARAQASSLDLTFNPGSGADDIVNAIAVQSDGKIVVAGKFTHVNGTTRNRIARLNNDGSVDATFDPGDGADGQINSVVLRTNGQIIIGGSFNTINGLRRSGMARLRADGSLDTTFVPDPGLNLTVNVLAIAVQTNDSIVIGGNFTASFNGTLHSDIARLTSGGTLDQTFDIPGAASTIFSMAFQSDGKLIVAGQFASFNNDTNHAGIVRLNADGNLDSNFNPSPLVAPFPFIRSFAIQPDGKIVILGGFVSINGYTRHNIARLNADGSLDLTFSAPLGATVNSADSVALTPDGKIFVACYQGGYNAGIFRLNSDGSTDAGFTPISVMIYAFEIKRLLFQPDGKLLTCGDFTAINGTNIQGIARLTVDDSSQKSPTLLNPQIYFGMNLSGSISNEYRIESTTDLNTTSLWTPILNVQLQTNSQFILDPNPITGQRYYHAVQLAP